VQLPFRFAPLDFKSLLFYSKPFFSDPACCLESSPLLPFVARSNVVFRNVVRISSIRSEKSSFVSCEFSKLVVWLQPTCFGANFACFTIPLIVGSQAIYFVLFNRSSALLTSLRISFKFREFRTNFRFPELVV